MKCNIEDHDKQIRSDAQVNSALSSVDCTATYTATPNGSK